MARDKDADTVLVDFDGVIHQYGTPPKSIGDIPDPPVPGAREAIANLRKHFYVVVCSTRCTSLAGKRAVEEWLHQNKIRVDDVTGVKIPAKVMIDDRAIRFMGDWDGILDLVMDFQPWNRIAVKREKKHGHARK